MRQHAPAAERNREAIRLVLADVLPRSGLLLEIASGTGQHVVHFARHFPGLTFQPSDLSPEARASIAAWAAEESTVNVLAPMAIDVTEEPWPIERADAIFCANMIHIAPWAACLGLLTGAGRLLPAGAPLVLYGPYRVDGRLEPESNQRFDASLRERDPSWGVRELREVESAANRSGLTLEQTVSMPANNLCVIFRRD